MMIENMLQIPFPSEQSAYLAKQCGAREGFGTNLYLYADALAAQFDLWVFHTENVEEAMQFQ